MKTKLNSTLVFSIQYKFMKTISSLETRYNINLVLIGYLDHPHRVLFWFIIMAYNQPTLKINNNVFVYKQVYEVSSTLYVFNSFIA